MSTATAEDEGKALKVKTVTNGKVTEWEFGDTGDEEINIYSSILEELTISDTTGYYNTSTKAFSTSKDFFVTNKIQCVLGDTFYLPDNTPNYSHATLITFDSNNNVLTCINANTGENGLEYICNAEDKYIVFGFNKSDIVNVLKKTGTTNNTKIIEAQKKHIDNMIPIVYDESTGIDLTQQCRYNGFVTSSGTTQYTGSKCLIMHVEVGDEFEYSGKAYGDIKFYFIKKKNGTVIEYDQDTSEAVNRRVRIIDEDAYSIGFSFYTRNNDTFSLKKITYSGNSNLHEVRKTIEQITTANYDDEGKVVCAKTVSGGKVTEWDFVRNGGEKLVYESIIENLTVSNMLGYYSTSTKEFVSNTGRIVTEPIECTEGDIFVIPDNKQTNILAALITFDTNDSVLTCTNTNTNGTELLYTCTSADKKISFGFEKNNPIDVCKFNGARGTEEIAEANETAIGRMEPNIFSEGEGINYSALVKYPGYCASNGLINEYSNARCVVLRCNVGDKYKYTGKIYGAMRYYYIRKANGNIIESDTFTGDATGRTVSITNPEAYSITFSFYIGNSNTFSLYKVNCDYTKYRSDEKVYDDKTWFAFGDSITYGVNGGYTTYVADKIGATLDNYGHSGDTIANALYVATNGAFGTSNSQTKLCSDYSNASIATIMIGTNGGVPDDWKTSFDNCPAFVYGQRINSLPWSRGGTTITTAADYYALFPDDVVGKYCFMVEWMMSQNQDMKLFLITPPPRNSSEIKAEVIRDMVMAIGGKYGIPVIDCLHNCMITLQNYNLYSSDGVHLNQKGNEIWGKYICEAIERFGAIFK